MFATGRKYIYPGFGFTLLVFGIFFLLTPAVVSESTFFQAETLTLAAPGPYAVGEWSIQLMDKERKLRVPVNIWYPAALSEGADPAQAVKDAEADRSGAPYPVILYSTFEWPNSVRALDYWFIHLASQGFVVAGITHKTGVNEPVDAPLDIVYVLDALAALEKGPVMGLADTDNAGVTGYGYGGYTTLAAGGAYFNTGQYLDYCASNAAFTAKFSEDACNSVDQWASLEAYAQEQGITTGDVWSPFVNDARIHALLPIVPTPRVRMLGDAGLAAVTTPTMIFSTGTSPLQADRQQVYNQLGSTDKFMLSIKDTTDNFGVYPFVSNGTLRPEDVAYLDHFSTAFFGHYLQGKADNAAYLTQDFVSQFPNLELLSSLEE